jgi:acrylyl-CoA reductase (NADPH)
MTFRGLLLTKDDDGAVAASITDLNDDQLPEGDVTIDVSHSTVNYKDGMAVMGVPGIVPKDGYPMVPGVDVVGTVADGGSSGWAPGSLVTVNGFGVGESHWGGLAQRARMKSQWLTAVPDGLSASQAAAIGTAGYTAMLCVIGLEKQGITPDSGAVLVTGAAGGVGSVAVALLSKLGYQVTASTGRAGAEGDYLRRLGATTVMDRAELSEAGRPLQKSEYAAAVDPVGSATLANVLARMNDDGVVTACGLAQGSDLPTTVLPFILRGVTLVGINCVYRPQEDRAEAWSRLAQDLDASLLDELTTNIGLDEVPATAAQILEGQVRGRVVVDVSG